MKVCPACQQTYADESLNFCLNDGAVLVKNNQSYTATPPETVFMNQPQSPATVQQTNPVVPASWGNRSNINRAASKSRTWLWVLGIFGAVIVLCGGGFFALVALVADSENSNVSNAKVFGNNSPVANTKINNSGKTNSLLNDNLSTWKLPDQNYGITEYHDGELYMTSKPGNFYLALLSGSSDFRTDDATTKVTVRNTVGTATGIGFGLMVHNNIAVPLMQDYAFLIDSATQSYRVVKHRSRKETELINWTADSSIKAGTQKNLLEVRDDGSGKMDFYINGKFVTSVEDQDGITSGVAGLYSGGAIPIAFSNLQIEK